MQLPQPARGKNSEFKNTNFQNDIMVFCSSTYLSAEDNQPSIEAIQSWWIQNSQEKMTIEGGLTKITLVSTDAAYKVPVRFNRGRNFTWTMAMVRPATKQVQEMALFLRQGKSPS